MLLLFFKFNPQFSLLLPLNWTAQRHPYWSIDAFTAMWKYYFEQMYLLAKIDSVLQIHRFFLSASLKFECVQDACICVHRKLCYRSIKFTLLASAGVLSHAVCIFQPEIIHNLTWIFQFWKLKNQFQGLTSSQ